ncbi:MAG: 23S rRNA (adenine(2503)-C(2))-methyltransferase RlmN [Myxococcota bacterium]
METTGLTSAALGALMPRDDRPSPTRGKAVWRWLRGLSPEAWESGAATAWPDAIPDVAAAALASLRAHARPPDLRVEERVASLDGTLKWRLACRGAPVETVLIPTPTRATVCVSSQSGCTRWCDFCATARMPFAGSLTAGQIVAQVLLARASATVPVTNVVFMGMGEPLDNLDQVLAAIAVLDDGVGLAPRHVTVSTSGVLPALERLWRESRASVALSLHATTQELRDRLMPRVRKWPIADLVAFMRAASAAEDVAAASGRKPRHFFIEYALMEGVNDGPDDAERLVALLAGVRARVNLIPFNGSDPGGGVAPILYRRPSPERIRAFQACVMAAGFICIVRETRGDDAAAACGQLAYRASALGGPA